MFQLNLTKINLTLLTTAAIRMCTTFSMERNELHTQMCQCRCYNNMINVIILGQTETENINTITTLQITFLLKKYYFGSHLCDHFGTEITC
jgi:hypothetical protein